jgi:hypothetical protein
MLISDGIIDRATLDGGRLGLDVVGDAVAKAPNASASGTLRAVEDAVREAVQDPLSDDATLVVVVPHRTVLAEGL